MTNGGVNSILTILALAWRVSEHLAVDSDSGGRDRTGARLLRAPMLCLCKVPEEARARADAPRLMRVRALRREHAAIQAARLSAGPHGQLGLAATAAVARPAHRAARRPAVLRAHRADPRPRLVAGRSARATASHRGARRRPPALRTPSAPPRPRRRDGPRRRPADVIQRQLGHTNLGISSIYLQGIDSAAVIDTVHARPAPVVPVTSTLRP
jgi:hypothetical protein